MHHTTPQFWSHFERLPEAVQRTARRNFQLLKDSPRHPSLQFKKVNEYWAVRVGRPYRAIASKKDKTCSGSGSVDTTSICGSLAGSG